MAILITSTGIFLPLQSYNNVIVLPRGSLLLLIWRIYDCLASAAFILFTKFGSSFRWSLTHRIAHCSNSSFRLSTYNNKIRPLVNNEPVN